MNIIIDTREQKPLKFTGHKTTHRKLDEGDYNIEELIPYIVIERKSLSDFYGSIIQGHERFKNEIVRSRLQNKTFYIFIEGTLEQFFEMNWSKKKRTIKSEVLKKIVNTMQERHQISIVECETRKIMEKMILITLELNKKLYGVENNE